jgi:hypothetical protein
VLDTQIEHWRAGLDEARRHRLNHPNSVWSHWQRATRPRHITKAKAPNGGGGRHINWPQDAVRRVAAAIRENWSNDTYQLARVALQAAIRTEADLYELLPPAAPARSEAA